MEHLQYPVGRYQAPEYIAEAQLNDWITQIAQLPDLLRNAVESLNQAQLQTPYRPGGWTVQQVVHHLADSHMNSLIRFKLALTEDNPTIKPYHEDRWANLADTLDSPVADSLLIVEGVHRRWVYLLRAMTKEDFKRTFYHPENKREMVLDNVVGLYAWHSRHHLAHITHLAARAGWKS